MNAPHLNPMAYLNHGRWVVDCPDPDCAGAELAREVFVCSNCKRTTEVEWPDDKSLIDNATAVRSVPQTRNWRPGETLDDLNRENEMHGVTNR